MAKRLPPEDPDYLATTQLAVKPSSFKERVKEAYSLEYGRKLNKEIAEVLGVDKSWITQLFKHPEEHQSIAIERLLAPIKSKVHRRNIVGAWVAVRFGVDLRKPEPDQVVRGEITEFTIRRIDRLLRQNRLVLAAQTAEQALRISGDYEIRQQLLDRAFWARQRLEQPGRAMIVARSIVVAARKKREPLREAHGFALRARTILGMSDCTPEECEPLIGAARQLALAGGEPPSPHPPYHLATAAYVQALAFNALITFIERGLVTADQDELRQMLGTIEAKLKQQTRQEPERFRSSITASRLCLLLGETFKAQEYVDQAFASGGLKNLEAMEVCGVFQGRIVQVAESPERASDYLR